MSNHDFVADDGFGESNGERARLALDVTKCHRVPGGEVGTSRVEGAQDRVEPLTTVLVLGDRRRDLGPRRFESVRRASS